MNELEYDMSNFNQRFNYFHSMTDPRYAFYSNSKIQKF